jgi:hypothetical protein
MKYIMTLLGLILFSTGLIFFYYLGTQRIEERIEKSITYEDISLEGSEYYTSGSSIVIDLDINLSDTLYFNPYATIGSFQFTHTTDMIYDRQCYSVVNGVAYAPVNFINTTYDTQVIRESGEIRFIIDYSNCEIMELDEALDNLIYIRLDRFIEIKGEDSFRYDILITSTDIGVD